MTTRAAIIETSPAAGGEPRAARAARTGTWNTVSGVAGMTFTLVASDGSPSGVTLSQSPTTTLLTTSDPSVSGDDAKLLDNGLVTTGAETCLSFQGFEAGRYEVLIYAWLPGQPAVKSRTRQDEAPATIDVGGAWSGAHVENVTYARYVVDVGSDGVLPAHSGLVPGAPDSALNGVQIRPLPMGTDAGASAGGGGDAGTDAGPHGGGCSTGGGTGGPVALVLLALVAARRQRR